MYALLKQFEKREGHCTKVPVSHTEDRIGLGRWVEYQRYSKKEGTLDPDRQTRLEEIGWCGSCKKNNGTPIVIYATEFHPFSVRDEAGSSIAPRG
jgi:hypothetical protein